MVMVIGTLEQPSAACWPSVSQPAAATPAPSPYLATLSCKKTRQQDEASPGEGLIGALRPLPSDIELGCIAPLDTLLREEEASLAASQPLARPQPHWFGLRWLAGQLQRLGSHGSSSSMQEELNPDPASGPSDGYAAAADATPPAPVLAAVARRRLAAARWRLAGGAVLDGRAMQRDMDMLLDRMAHPADRFAAAACLELRLARHPRRTVVMAALARRQESLRHTIWAQLLQELYVTGAHDGALMTKEVERAGTDWPLNFLPSLAEIC